MTLSGGALLWSPRVTEATEVVCKRPSSDPGQLS